MLDKTKLRKNVVHDLRDNKTSCRLDTIVYPCKNYFQHLPYPQPDPQMEAKIVCQLYRGTFKLLYVSWAVISKSNLLYLSKSREDYCWLLPEVTSDILHGSLLNVYQYLFLVAVNFLCSLQHVYKYMFPVTVSFLYFAFINFILHRTF